MIRISDIRYFFSNNEAISDEVSKIFSFVNAITPTVTTIETDKMIEALVTGALKDYEGASAIVAYLTDKQSDDIEDQVRFDMCFSLYCHQVYDLAIHEHLKSLIINENINTVIKQENIPQVEYSTNVWRPELTNFNNWLLAFFKKGTTAYLYKAAMDEDTVKPLIETIDKDARNRLLDILSEPSTNYDWVYKYMQLDALKGQIDGIDKIPALIEETLLNFKEPFSTSSAKQVWSQYRQYLKSLHMQNVLEMDFAVEKLYIMPDYQYYCAGIQKRHSYDVRQIYESTARKYPIGKGNLVTLLTLLISTRTPKKDLIFIFGKQGIGKTTLCQILASRLADIEYVHPIYIPLKYINPSEDILTEITNYLENISLKDILKDLYNCSNVVFILDGFDELSQTTRQDIGNFLNKLEHFNQHQYPNAAIIITGRDTLFHENDVIIPADTHVITLQPFDKKQIIGRYSPTGYCGSIELTAIGQNLQIWTNGKYQFIKKEIAVKLLRELLERLTI